MKVDYFDAVSFFREALCMKKFEFRSTNAKQYW